MAMYAIKNIINEGTEWERVIWFTKKDGHGEVWHEVLDPMVDCFATSRSAKAALTRRLEVYPEHDGRFELWLFTDDRYGMSHHAVETWRYSSCGC